MIPSRLSPTTLANKEAARASIRKRIRWRLKNWLLINPLIAFIRLLTPDQASAFAGWIMSHVGPRLSKNRIALDNLSRVFPEMPPKERSRVARQMWANWGRVLGEYPHLPQILKDPRRWEIFGLDEVNATIGEDKAAFLLSAHYGNWEVTIVAGRTVGLLQANIYQPVKDPILDATLRQLREVTASGGLIEQGDGNIRTMSRLLRRGVSVGLLVDLREERGVKVPFLGINAYTVHAPALLARRLGVPIYVGRAIRTHGAHFRVETRHVPVQKTDDWEADAIATTAAINQVFTEWIMERPEQWVWFRRRWDDR